MKIILILTIASILFGCTSTDNGTPEVKRKIESSKAVSTDSNKKSKSTISPTSSTAAIRSIRTKHVFDKETIVSIIQKAFDESGKIVYAAPSITWNGPPKDISLPAGNYQVLIQCWENSSRVYNFHRVQAHIENGKDYTFFCLKETGKVFLGLKGVVGLYAFYSETSQLEISQKKYQSEIDKFAIK